MTVLHLGETEASNATAGRSSRLLVLFGVLYFVQGVVEPTACLPAQPLQTSLQSHGLGPAALGAYFGIIGIAWSLKPAYGALSDFFPLAGTHRWSYLVASTAACGLGFVLLGMSWNVATAFSMGRWLLVGVGVAIAFSDVVIDAVAVQEGNRRGLTGTIQSVQWGANSLASVFTGVLGGWLAERRAIHGTFAICAVLALAALVIVVTTYREPRRSERPTDNLRTAVAELRTGNRMAVLASASAFLLLWNFNPFTSSVLQTYSTEELHLSQQYFGMLLSLQAVAQVVACVAYAAICRRVSFGKLIHLSIVGGIVSTVAYFFMNGPFSAAVANIVFGLAYQLAMLATMDLAARASPAAAAGTTFALLMALCNTAPNAAMYLGGTWYEAMTISLGGARASFQALVLIGAACTAACWFVVPWMKRAGVPWD